ncbi:nuclear transport factor 2 family protein [Streptomyces sp. NPDC000410]|uniref:nuclear transport factor 2 family protein n=1 Tax=Streptomyces sp. NPDC000410 TaxID=3154254 RepID=UPI003325E40D
MSEATTAVAAAIEGELRLLDPAVRGDAARLAALLHPHYLEFGVSGRRWDRDSIIESLTRECASQACKPITASDVKGTQLADDVVHLTFVTEAAGRRAHRSSLWRLTDGDWLLYFHQGTPFSADESSGAS